MQLEFKLEIVQEKILKMVLLFVKRKLWSPVLILTEKNCLLRAQDVFEYYANILGIFYFYFAL